MRLLIATVTVVKSYFPEDSHIEKILNSALKEMVILLDTGYYLMVKDRK